MLETTPTSLDHIDMMPASLDHVGSSLSPGKFSLSLSLIKKIQRKGPKDNTKSYALLPDTERFCVVLLVTEKLFSLAGVCEREREGGRTYPVIESCWCDMSWPASSSGWFGLADGRSGDWRWV
jgi:hypothetical protein